MKFEIRPEANGEWSLVVYQNGEQGNYSGIGSLNGEIEARLVCRSLNKSLADEIVRGMWTDYFDADWTEQLADLRHKDGVSEIAPAPGGNE